MHNVAITQWGTLDVGQADDYQVFAFSDLETINRPIAEPKDLALALQEVAGGLYDYQKEVISTKRNQSNDAWLALCKKVE